MDPDNPRTTATICVTNGFYTTITLIKDQRILQSHVPFTHVHIHSQTHTLMVILLSDNHQPVAIRFKTTYYNQCKDLLKSSLQFYSSTTKLLNRLYHYPSISWICSTPFVVTGMLELIPVTDGGVHPRHVASLLQGHHLQATQPILECAFKRWLFLMKSLCKCS